MLISGKCIKWPIPSPSFLPPSWFTVWPSLLLSKVDPGSKATAWPHSVCDPQHTRSFLVHNTLHFITHHKSWGIHYVMGQTYASSLTVMWKSFMWQSCDLSIDTLSSEFLAYHFLFAVMRCCHRTSQRYLWTVQITSTIIKQYVCLRACVRACACVCVCVRACTTRHNDAQKAHRTDVQTDPSSPYTPGDIAPVCFDPPNRTGVNQHHSSLWPRSVSAYTCNVIILVSEGRWL